MINWGDVPTWVQSGATALLLIAAIIAGVFTYRIYRIESARDERHEEERRSEQAGKIAAWMKGAHNRVINNASTLPVYDMIVDYSIRYGRGDQPVDVGMEQRSFLPPGEHVGHVPSGVATAFEPVREGPAEALIRLTFTDASGWRWRRNHDGWLEHVSDPG